MFYTFFWSILTAIALWATVAFLVASARYRFPALMVRSVAAAMLATSFALRLTFGLGSLGRTEPTHMWIDIASAVLFSAGIMCDLFVVVRENYKAEIAARHLTNARLMLFR